MKRLLAKLGALRWRRDDGASAVEYGLLVALIAVAISAAVIFLGDALTERLTEACTQIGSAETACESDGEEE